MTLSGKQLLALDNCAHAIVSGNLRTGPDMPFGDDLSFMIEKDAIIGALTEGVERHSGGRMSLRTADKNLFAETISGLCLYLVRCAPGTPQGEVTRLTSDMVLVRASAHRNGVVIGVQPAR